MDTQRQYAEFVERSRCIACCSERLLELSSGRFDEQPLCDFIANDPWGENPLPYLRGSRWSYVRCQDCETAFHKNILSPEWNERRFSEWMTQEAIAECLRNTRTPAAIFWQGTQHTKHVLQLERLTRRLRGSDPVRLLDFGCGYGEFIAMCDIYGFAAVGIDRSSAKRDNARAMKITPEIEDIEGLPPFHVVTLFEVLEHLDDPRAILEQLSRHLVPGGILVLETPDCSGVTGIATFREYQNIHPLEHINGFTPHTLRSLAERLGFEVVSKPVSQVTCDPQRVLKTEVKRAMSRFLRTTTQQYFRKR